MKHPTLILCLVQLSACAGVGVVASQDPLTKLNDAEVLFTQKNRPVPAEHLIAEAITIYQRGDDAHGLGNAYREYADFLTSPALARWEPQYRRYGFVDASVTFDNRINRAKDFYRKALGYYEVAANQRKTSGQYDALTNIYFNMAWSHLALGETDLACSDFDRTVQAYEENMRRNPSAKPHIPARFSNLTEAVSSAKQHAGCKSG